jgi:hypothetical protein
MRNTVLFVMAILTLSCEVKYHDSISGNGRVRTETVSYDTISRINVSNNLDVTIIPSDSVRVVLIADENLMGIIHCDVLNGTLSIFPERNIRMAKSKEIKVYSPYVTSIDASTRAIVTSSDDISCSELNLIASTAAEIRLKVKVKTLELTASTGSNVDLEGSADYLSVNAGTASDINAYDLKVKECDVLASSAADVRVTISDKARLSANSAADIRYRGEPKILDSRTGSLGDIRRVKF